jgi:sugar phosphate isomerase/epimerase
MKKLGTAVQMYTLRDDCANDFEKTIREVAKIGFEGVEFAGYYGWDAHKLKALLDEVGLQAIGSHVGIDAMKTNLAQEIETILTLGAKYLICPYSMPADRHDAAQWQELFAFFEQVGRETAKRGITFLYHNHDFELTLKINDELVFDALFQSTSKQLVQVEMDICWVQYAGLDPVSYIGKYAGRLPAVHMKDFSKDAEGKIITLELGQGLVALDQVISAAKKASVEWLVVEQDTCQKAPLESVANSLNWLKQRDLTN